MGIKDWPFPKLQEAYSDILYYHQYGKWYENKRPDWVWELTSEHKKGTLRKRGVRLRMATGVVLSECRRRVGDHVTELGLIITKLRGLFDQLCESRKRST